MSDTPRTDAQANLTGAGGPPTWHIHADFARQLERELAEVRRDRDAWKANHDNQVTINRALRDRPDLGERAKLVAGLIQQRDTLAEALETVLDEVRNDYMACKDEVKAALAAVKGGSYE